MSNNLFSKALAAGIVAIAGIQVTTILALGLSVKAELDPEVHKMCLKAADYKGCIKAQSKPLDLNKRFRNREEFKNQKWKSVSISESSNVFSLAMVGQVLSDKNYREFDLYVLAIVSEQPEVATDKIIVDCKNKKIAAYLGRNESSDWIDIKKDTGHHQIMNYVCYNKRVKGMKAFDKRLGNYIKNMAKTFVEKSKPMFRDGYTKKDALKGFMTNKQMIETARLSFINSYYKGSKNR